MLNIEKIQEQLLENELLLVELELENTTPVIIGGYNARPFSVALNLMEEPRPTEVKGMWRWWARSLVSGALLRKGIDVTIAEANRIIAPLFGGILGDKLEPSKLSISIDVLDKDVIDLSKYIDRRRNRENIEIMRLKLLSQGLRGRRDYQERFKAFSKLCLRLRVYGYYMDFEKIPKSFYEFPIHSLVISLIFSGLGAITTRAFGSVRVKVSKLGKTLSNMQSLIRLQEILDTLFYKDRISVSEAKNLIWEIIRLALNSASMYANSIRARGSSKVSGLPSMPSIITGNANTFRLEVLSCRANMYKLLSIIGGSVLKQQMKRPCFGVDPRDSGVDIHTFIIGLPRSSKIPYGNLKLRTGYVVPSQMFNQRQRRFDSNQIREAINAIDEERTGKLRRLSTIGFTVLRNNPPLVLVYGMLSRDIDIIKREIVHRGVHGVTGPQGHVNNIIDTRVDHVKVINEFNKLWNCVLQLIRSKC